MQKFYPLKNIVILVLISTFIISCGPKVIYKHKETLGQAWLYGDSLWFEYEIVDISKPYNLKLNVNHSSSFSYENLYVNVTTVFPDSNKTSSPLSLQFSDSAGNWQGNCDSSNCDLTIEMSTKAYFQSAGKYTIIFDQFSRIESLEGVNSFEMILEEAE